MDAKTFDRSKLPSCHAQIMRALLDGDYLHEDCITGTGKTIEQNLENVKFNENHRVVYPVSTPISATGRVIGLQGSLAPDGAIVKVAGMTQLKFRGPVRVFDSKEDCLQAVENRAYRDGDVFIIRYEGPKGGPGMREMLSTTEALDGQGAGDMISIDADEGRLDLDVSEAVLAERRKTWKPPANPYQSGVLRKYGDQVGTARQGAVTHAGGKAEIICYADI